MKKTELRIGDKIYVKWGAVFEDAVVILDGENPLVKVTSFYDSKILIDNRDWRFKPVQKSCWVKGILK